MPTIVTPISRVLVLGCPGAGKTTTAKQLSALTMLPLYHLDDEYWGPGWSRLDPESWQRRQHQLTAGERWIIDGNYFPTIRCRTGRAELIVIVDTTGPRCLLRVAVRALRIKAGRWDGLPAKIRAQGAAGQRVRATRDFFSLLRLIATFRYTTWPALLDEARRSPGAIVIAVGPGRARWRARRLRRRLRQLDSSILVVEASRLEESFPLSPDPSTTTTPERDS